MLGVERREGSCYSFASLPGVGGCPWRCALQTRCAFDITKVQQSTTESKSAALRHPLSVSPAPRRARTCSAMPRRMFSMTFKEESRSGSCGRYFTLRPSRVHISPSNSLSAAGRSGYKDECEALRAGAEGLWKDGGRRHNLRARKRESMPPGTTLQTRDRYSVVGGCAAPTESAF